MPTVSEQIRRLQMRGSAEHRARAAREARRQAERFKARGGGQETGIRAAPDFAKQLDRKAAEARERLGMKRADLPQVIEKLRLEGKLPSAPDDLSRVRYEPTPEEILGDDAIEKLTPAPPAVADPVPDAETVLSTAGGGVTDFAPEELAEIARMNPDPGKRQGKGKRR